MRARAWVGSSLGGAHVWRERVHLELLGKARLELLDAKGAVPVSVECLEHMPYAARRHAVVGSSLGRGLGDAESGQRCRGHFGHGSCLRGQEKAATVAAICAAIGAEKFGEKLSTEPPPGYENLVGVTTHTTRDDAIPRCLMRTSRVV